MSICRNFLFLTFDLVKSFDLANRIIALAQALNDEAESLISDAMTDDFHDSIYNYEHRFPTIQRSWNLAFHLCPMQDKKAFFKAIADIDTDADIIDFSDRSHTHVSYLNFANSFQYFTEVYYEYLQHLESKPNEAFIGGTIVNVCLSFDSYERPCNLFIEQLKTAYSGKDDAFGLAYYFDIPFLDLAGAITINEGVESRHTLSVSSVFKPYFAERGDGILMIERASCLEDVQYALNALFLLSERVKHRKSVENAFLKAISL